MQQFPYQFPPDTNMTLPTAMWSQLFGCYPLSSMGSVDTLFKPAISCFKDECRSLDIQNMALNQMMDRLKRKNEGLKERIEELEAAKLPEEKNSDQKKRRRRGAREISRHFQCAQCKKAYG